MDKNARKNIHLDASVYQCDTLPDNMCASSFATRSFILYMIKRTMWFLFFLLRYIIHALDCKKHLCTG